MAASIFCFLSLCVSEDDGLVPLVPLVPMDVEELLTVDGEVGSGVLSFLPARNNSSPSPGKSIRWSRKVPFSSNFRYKLFTRASWPGMTIFDGKLAGQFDRPGNKDSLSWTVGARNIRLSPKFDSHPESGA